MSPERPAALFDRESEWHDLASFAGSTRPGPRLGIVHGRRRQGKSTILRGLVAATHGIYHQALEEERRPALERIGALLAESGGIPGLTVGVPDWMTALHALIDQAGPERPIVIDELPYLLARSPELPSVIQQVFDDARAGAGPSFRLLLCGSAISVMSSLLTGQHALRGRAVLDLVIRPFDFRTAARFWGIEDPEVAFQVHAITGGTPGYRELFDGQVPVGRDGLRTWLTATALNPAHAMFHEAEYLLTEDPAMTDRALYQSVLAAIAGGRSTRSAVAAALGRDDSSLRHPLMLLERAAFIRRDEDLLRQKRPLLRIADPYLRFHHAVVRPDLARFEARALDQAWPRAQERLASNVFGPHFEQLAREWTQTFASVRTLGGAPGRVGFAQLNDRARRSTLEVDVLALDDTGDHPRVLAMGEAKGGTTARTMRDVSDLDHARVLLGGAADTAGARLLLFSRSGFDAEVRRAAAARTDLELIDLERLYGGD